MQVTVRLNPACLPSCCSMWSKNGIPVSAFASPAPSSSIVTWMSVSFVVRVTFAVRLIARAPP